MADDRSHLRGSGAFLADMGRSFRAMLRDPRLVLISLVIGTAGYAGSLLPPLFAALVGLLTLPPAIFNVGFVGTERIWFARLFHGETLNGRGIWRWTWHLFTRYLLLGLLVLAILSPLIIAGIAVSVDAAYDAARESGGFDELSTLDSEKLVEEMLSGPLLLLTLAGGVLASIILTFSSPALAFTTNKPTEALKINFRTIRATLPTSLLYVLVPPLASTLVLFAAPLTDPRSAAFFPLALVGYFMTLWMKGTIASFYLRHSESYSAATEAHPAG